MPDNLTAANDTRILSLDHVGLYYSRRRGFLKRSRFWALKDVSFDLYAGETLGVIGRNGVGKSTLLRVLAGIIAPDTGRMEVLPGIAYFLEFAGSRLCAVFERT